MPSMVTPVEYKFDLKTETYDSVIPKNDNTGETNKLVFSDPRLLRPLERFHEFQLLPLNSPEE